MARRREVDPCADTVPSRPVRTCVGCRQRAGKHELLRVVARPGPHGLAVEPDPAGRAPGRGAHLHPTIACFDLAVRRRAFSRALRVREKLASTPLQDYLQQQAPARP